MSPSLLCLMTEASQRWGMGHLVRSLAVAQSWRALGGEAVFCMAEAFAPAEKMIAAGGFTLIRAVEARRMSALGDLRPQAVVIDFPRAGYDTCRALVNSGYVVAHIDDLGPSSSDAAQLIVNPNLDALNDSNINQNHLLGPRYALLRPRFAELHASPRVTRENDLHLLIIFGGTDAAGLTPMAIRAAANVETVARITVALSQNAPTHTEVSSLSRRIPKVRLVSDDPEMAEIMGSCDLVVGAAGTTVMELACLGVPQLVCPVVDGQRRNAQAWANAGAVVELPDPMKLNADRMRSAIAELAQDSRRREAMSAASKILIDGQGSRRFCERLRGAIEP